MNRAFNAICICLSFFIVEGTALARPAVLSSVGGMRFGDSPDDLQRARPCSDLKASDKNYVAEHGYSEQFYCENSTIEGIECDNITFTFKLHKFVEAVCSPSECPGLNFAKGAERERELRSANSATKVFLGKVTAKHGEPTIVKDDGRTAYWFRDHSMAVLVNADSRFNVIFLAPQASGANGDFRAIRPHFLASKAELDGFFVVEHDNDNSTDGNDANRRSAEHLPTIEAYIRNSGMCEGSCTKMRGTIVSHGSTKKMKAFIMKVTWQSISAELGKMDNCALVHYVAEPGFDDFISIVSGISRKPDCDGAQVAWGGGGQTIAEVVRRIGYDGPVPGEKPQGKPSDPPPDAKKWPAGFAYSFGGFEYQISACSNTSSVTEPYKMFVDKGSDHTPPAVRLYLVFRESHEHIGTDAVIGELTKTGEIFNLYVNNEKNEIIGRENIAVFESEKECHRVQKIVARRCQVDIGYDCVATLIKVCDVSPQVLDCL